MNPRAQMCRSRACRRIDTAARMADLRRWRAQVPFRSKGHRVSRIVYGRLCTYAACTCGVTFRESTPDAFVLAWKAHRTATWYDTTPDLPTPYGRHHQRNLSLAQTGRPAVPVSGLDVDAGEPVPGVLDALPRFDVEVHV